jgi:hypothetical protein
MITEIECLKEALEWWEKDAQYKTTGEYGEFNVFTEDPDWVEKTREILANDH